MKRLGKKASGGPVGTQTPPKPSRADELFIVTLDDSEMMLRDSNRKYTGHTQASLIIRSLEQRVRELEGALERAKAEFPRESY